MSNLLTLDQQREKDVLDILGVFAVFETNIRRKCQLEGIAKAKVEGWYLGCKPTARDKSQQVVESIGQELTKKAVTKEFGVGVITVYPI